MIKQNNSRTFSIRITVLGVFLFVSVLTAGLTLGLQLYFSHDLARTAAGSTFFTTSEMINERVRALDTQSVNLLGVLSNAYELETFPDPEQEQRSLSLLCGAMENTKSIYAVYLGYATGEFFEIINLDSSSKVRKAFGAAPQDRWLTIKVLTVEGERKRILTFLDPEFRTRAEKVEATVYDPRGRPWYKDAPGAPRIIKTAPYIFSNLKSPGVTYATSLDNGGRVAAVDISLAGLSDFLQEQKLMQESKAFIFDKKGDIIAQASRSEKKAMKEAVAGIELEADEKAFLEENPVIKASNEMDWPPFDFTLSGKPLGYSVDLLDLLAAKAGFRVEYVNGYSWGELLGLFQAGKLDLLHSLVKTPEREDLGLFSQQYIPLPQTYVVKKGTSLPSSLASLENKTVAIPKGWATDIYLEQNHPEIKRVHVSSTLEAMRAVSSGKVYATMDSEPVVHYLAAYYFLDNLKIDGSVAELSGTESHQGLHFVVKTEKSPLVSILNKALQSLTEQEREVLSAKWFGIDNGKTESGDISGTVPHPELLESVSNGGSMGELKVLEIEGREYFSYVSQVESAYNSSEYLGLLVPVKEMMRPYMEKVRFSILLTLVLLSFLVPIVLYCSSIIVKPINALSLESNKVRERRYREVVQIESNITEIVGLSRSMVSMASSIEAYEQSLKELMDSLIQLIAGAIDRKSPYTGGHCARVPELSLMLAEAATNSVEGKFAQFGLRTEDEWREFKTAAWLHDCGKVATPEHIVDKATKLETIYNRIHEVRMRFEVLLRDSEITYWKGLAEGGDGASLAQELEEKRQEIWDDYAFIAECNLGGEFMEEDDIARVKQLAQTTWVRHLSDRLGLGQLELDRYTDDEPALPCEEPLLSDRPEHLIEHPVRSGGGDNGSDFAMKPLEKLYNLGEIYNLCITRGTLTAEDRYKINEHIITTIEMLEALPFPENMTRIPEYAGAHHETLIGTGYPRQLTAEQLSIPARIMAIADVFEALTASDRPYKKAKTLSEAVRILSFMVKDNHLDADLYKLFLERGLHLEYARKYLDPSLIDEVNIADYL